MSSQKGPDAENVEASRNVLERILVAVASEVLYSIKEKKEKSI